MRIHIHNEEKSKREKQNIDIIINSLIMFIGELGRDLIDIIDKTVKNYPILVKEDDEKMTLREQEELRIYMSKNKTDSEGYNKKIEKEMEEKLKKYRLNTITPQIEIGLRMSSNLIKRFKKKNGYTWSDYFSKPENESIYERTARESITEEMREEYRIKLVEDIILHSYEYWGNIYDKDLQYLSNLLRAMFPNSEYTDKLELIYGNKENKKSYIEDEDIDNIWDKVHNIIRMCIKYMFYCESSCFKLVSVKNPSETKKEIYVDVEGEINIWEVKTNVRTDNIAFWDEYIV